MFIVEDFKKDSGRGDTFQVLVDTPISLDDITTQLAKELGLFKGESVRYRVEEVDSQENLYKGREGYLQIMYDWVSRLGKDVLIRPRSPNEDGTKPTDNYLVHEVNLAPDVLRKFYHFLEERFG